MEAAGGPDPLAEARAEAELLRSVVLALKEDLNLKDEQLAHLFQSLRAATAHATQAREQEQAQLRAEVLRLQAALARRDREHVALTRALRRAAASRCADERRWFSLLPDDVAAWVFEFLPATSLAVCAVVNFHWRSLSEGERFWSSHFRRRWPQKPLSPERERAEPQPVPLLNLDSGEEVCVDFASGSPWKKLYGELHSLQARWAAGATAGAVTTLSGHTGTVTCMQMTGDRLVSGSDDGSMVLWALTGGGADSDRDLLLQQHHRQTHDRHALKLHSFFGHGGPIWALAVDEANGRLLSGSYDCTLKLWDLHSGNCLRTLRGHDGWLSCLQLSGDGAQAVSGSWDSSLRVWDLDSGEELAVVPGAAGNAVYCLLWDPASGAVVSGTRDSALQVTDLLTGQALAPLVGHVREVCSLAALGDWDGPCASGSADSTVKVWDRASGQCELTLAGHSGSVMCVQGSWADRKLVSGSYDKTVKLWDLRQPSAPLATFAEHSNAVFCLAYDERRLVTGSADTTLKLFQF